MNKPNISMTLVVDVITASPADIAAAFSEWIRRFQEDPVAAEAECRKLVTEEPKSYGEIVTPYFLELLREQITIRKAATRPVLAPGFSYSDAEGLKYARPQEDSL